MLADKNKSTRDALLVLKYSGLCGEELLDRIESELRNQSGGFDIGKENLAGELFADEPTINSGLLQRRSIRNALACSQI